MSDRIAVMLDGRVEQLADPFTIYEQPSSAFVAGFIGQQNFFEGTTPRGSGNVRATAGRSRRGATRSTSIGGGPASPRSVPSRSGSRSSARPMARTAIRGRWRASRTSGKCSVRRADPGAKEVWRGCRALAPSSGWARHGVVLVGRGPHAHVRRGTGRDRFGRSGEGRGGDGRKRAGADGRGRAGGGRKARRAGRDILASATARVG